jgi:hypothetical protein
LLGFSHIVLLLCLSSGITVSRESCYSTTNSTGSAVCNARTEVAELTLGFLLLAFSILLLAGAL